MLIKYKGNPNFQSPEDVIQQLLSDVSESEDRYWELRSKQLECQYIRDQLIEECDSLRYRMHDILLKAQQTTYSFSPNSLGEVQGRGLSIDMLCAVYAERTEKTMQWLFKNFPDHVEK